VKSESATVVLKSVASIVTAEPDALIVVFSGTPLDE
jgi:hypothetical protein